MSELIEIKKAVIGSESVNAVSARDLYLGLGLDKANWKRWSEQNISSNEFFSENTDWVGFVIKMNGNETRDFAVSVEMAKHLSMMAKTPKAHDYRNYFIALEQAQSANQPVYSENLRAEESLRVADFIAQSLRVSESSKLGMFQKVLSLKAPELLPILPCYAVDAPVGDLAGSSIPTKSTTALLKDNGYAVSAQAFNKIALADEWLEKLTRQSSKGVKEFLSVTNKGLKYGKNITSPTNPRETQPHWYVDSFKEFADLVLKGES